ncbi:hypothetical protein [Clostridium niameyense]|uniref:hypothetical protein n=1 Tax=Clostridium niameyense TaxID=1622073 RepID=UPI0013D8C8BB|nr:hypothetical protein [Clostridium niameyense]
MKDIVAITGYKMAESFENDKSILEVQFTFVSNDRTPNKFTKFLNNLDKFLKKEYKPLI